MSDIEEKPIEEIIFLNQRVYSYLNETYLCCLGLRILFNGNLFIKQLFVNNVFCIISFIKVKIIIGVDKDGFHRNTS